MIERIVENWLTEATERTYEVAFCYILSHKGYSVVHLTRHCSMELGKDIIALAPDGTPCAFQLKGGGVTLSDWRDRISGQIEDLVTGQITHPGVPEHEEHRSFFVTNGYLEEEVQRAIDDKNKKWQNIGYEPLEVVPKGELLDYALDLGPSLWPSELGDINKLIELHLSNGRQPFPKSELASLLEASLPLGGEDSPPAASCSRSLASGALLTALSSAPYSEEENHVAEVEAWTVFAAHVMATAERWSLDNEKYEDELLLAKRAIFNALSRLAEEVHNRDYYFEDRGALDGPFYETRLTWVVAMLSVFGLIRRSEKYGNIDLSLPNDSPLTFEPDAFIKEFCHQHRSSLSLWGEAAVPQLLAYYWYWRTVDASRQPASLLISLTKSVADSNQPRSELALPSPYYEASDLVPYIADGELRSILPDHLRLTKSPIGENFSGYAYTLEGLFLLLVRKMYRQHAENLWPSVSRITHSVYSPETSWCFYRWRNPDSGKSLNRQPPLTKSWSELRDIADEPHTGSLPNLLRQEPWFALLFLIVYPHRVSTDYILWLDSAIRDKAQGFYPA